MNIEAIAKKFGLKTDESINEPPVITESIKQERENEIYNRAIDDIIERLEGMKR